MPAALQNIDEDVLIYIISFLEPPEILLLRQTCKRIQLASRLRIVWTNACVIHILDHGYPLRAIPLERMSVPELEQRTLHAYRLAHKWLSGKCQPWKAIFMEATSSTPVSDVRFVPGHEHLLLTISKSIWSAVTLWDISTSNPRRCSTWSPRGAIFSGFALNMDPTSEANLVVSLSNDGYQSVEVLTLKIFESGSISLETIFSAPTNFRPMVLQGDLLALSDEVSQTAIWNIKEGTYAILQHFQADEGVWKDHCIQVLFCHRSVLVVRAQSVHLFPEPVLVPRDAEPVQYEPIARHSFGWVDGVSVTLSRNSNTYQKHATTAYPPLSLLVRPESDDPWSSNAHTLDLYVLPPNPDFIDSESSGAAPPLPHILQLDEAEHKSPTPTPIIPYSFPPTLTNQVNSVRGLLRCTDIILGPLGTAVWIQPQDRMITGLLWSDADPYPMQIASSSDTHESLVAAAFPGSLHPKTGKDANRCECRYATKSRKIYPNEANNWTSLDYDEENGRIALGSSYGTVTILKL